MKYVVLSFDDGRKDFYTNAFKILKKHHLPAVLNIISDYTKTNETEYVSWDEVKECSDCGIEIANHSAEHNNELESIVRGAKDIQKNLSTSEKIGFASPNSGVCRKNFDIYKNLLTSEHTAYVRSGNQLKRDGYFYAFLYLVYKYTASSKIFFWYNRRNIINLHKKSDDIFPSITCNYDNTVRQIIYFIEKMPDNSAGIIMLHRILEKGEDDYKKDKWSNTAEDFDLLCNYLAKNENVSVITHKELCELINVSQDEPRKK